MLTNWVTVVVAGVIVFLGLILFLIFRKVVRFPMDRINNNPTSNPDDKQLESSSVIQKCYTTTPGTTSKYACKFAVHEAAHAVVAHELGGEVLWANVGGDTGKPKMTKIEWKFDLRKLENVDWLEPSEAAPARDSVMKQVTCFVAGHLAESGVNSDSVWISKRLRDNMFHTDYDRTKLADRDAVALLLTMIQRPDIKRAVECEETARQILDKRKAWMKAIVDELKKNGYIEGKTLQTALSL